MPDLMTTFSFVAGDRRRGDGELPEVRGLGAETEIIEYKEATRTAR